MYSLEFPCGIMPKLYPLWDFVWDGTCGRQLPKWLPIIPTSWYSHLVESSLLECGIDRVTCFWPTKYGKNDSIPLPQWGFKSCAVCLGSLLAITFSLVSFGEASCLFGETYMERNWRQPLAKTQQGTEALCPMYSYVYAANIHWVGVEADPSQVELSDDTADSGRVPWLPPCDRPWSRGLNFTLPGFLTHGNYYCILMPSREHPLQKRHGANRFSGGLI